MDFCKDTCDHRQVGRPATGKTHVRNLRSPDEVWLPALARAVAEGETLTDVPNASLRDYGRSPPRRRPTFAARADAPPWPRAPHPRSQPPAAPRRAATPVAAR